MLIVDLGWKLGCQQSIVSRWVDPPPASLTAQISRIYYGEQSKYPTSIRGKNDKPSMLLGKKRGSSHLFHAFSVKVFHRIFLGNLTIAQLAHQVIIILIWGMGIERKIRDNFDMVRGFDYHQFSTRDALKNSYLVEIFNPTPDRGPSLELTKNIEMLERERKNWKSAKLHFLKHFVQWKR